MAAQMASHMPYIVSGVTAVIGLLISILSFLVIRLINKIDESQSKQAECLSRISERLSRLEGEHMAVQKYCAMTLSKTAAQVAGGD